MYKCIRRSVYTKSKIKRIIVSPKWSDQIVVVGTSFLKKPSHPSMTHVQKALALN